MRFWNKNPASRPNITNNISYVGGQASVPSTAFGAQTYQIRIATQVAGSIKIDGSSVTATNADAYLCGRLPGLHSRTVCGIYFIERSHLCGHALHLLGRDTMKTFTLAEAMSEVKPKRSCSGSPTTTKSSPIGRLGVPTARQHRESSYDDQNRL
jgi:hypothetical protein